MGKLIRLLLSKFHLDFQIKRKKGEAFLIYQARRLEVIVINGVANCLFVEDVMATGNAS